MSALRARLGIAALAIAVGSGCGLLLDLDPPEARHMECFVTVENSEGVRVDISSLTHPDFVRAVPSFGGGGGVPPGGGSVAPIRPYYVCSTSACGPCFHASTADAEAAAKVALGMGVRSPDAAYFVAKILAARGNAEDAHKIAKAACESKDGFVYRKETEAMVAELEKKLPPPKK